MDKCLPDHEDQLLDEDYRGSQVAMVSKQQQWINFS